MIDHKHILLQARRAGACAATADIHNTNAMFNLLFSPQGREFCIPNNFPSLEIWQEAAKEEDLRKRGIYVDAGKMAIKGTSANLCFVGNTDAECFLTSPTTLYHVMAMHGAKVKIIARQYAVVMVSMTKDCTIITDQDSTSIIDYEYR